MTDQVGVDEEEFTVSGNVAEGAANYHPKSLFRAETPSTLVVNIHARERLHEFRLMLIYYSPCVDGSYPARRGGREDTAGRVVGRGGGGGRGGGVEQAEVVAAAEVPVSAVHGAVLQVVGKADAPLPQ